MSGSFIVAARVMDSEVGIEVCGTEVLEVELDGGAAVEVVESGPIAGGDRFAGVKMVGQVAAGYKGFEGQQASPFSASG